MSDASKLVIIGDGEFAEIAYEYFTHDSDHEVVAFSVERDFLQRDSLFDLPVVPFEELQDHYEPDRCGAFVAVTYTQLNRVRARLYRQVKEMGYTPVSYVSSKAFVWRNVEIGENCFVFENNVIQYHVSIGDNVVLWSGNHVGHRTRIEDNCFVSSHVVISGYCEIGTNSFLGVNCCIGDFRKVGADCIVGAGAVVVKNLEPGQVYVGNPARPTGDSFTTFKVPEGSR